MLTKLCAAFATLALGAGLLAPTFASQTAGAREVSHSHASTASRLGNAVRFREMYKLYPSSVVARGSKVHYLPQGKALSGSIGGVPVATAIDRYVTEHRIAGFIVVQHGRIRYERYALGFTPGSRWTSFSVAKSVTSILVGIALKEGYIHSLSDKITQYIPALRHTVYQDVTIRDFLTMTSGVRWNETYSDSKSDLRRFGETACVGHQPSAVTYLSKLPREWPAGSHFNYNSGDADLLGVALQRATHQSLASYLSTQLWKPYGMGANAYWLKDRCSGLNTGASGISMTLRDYARLGQFMLDGARIHGVQVVSQAWLKDATKTLEHSTFYGDFGYGYLFWVGPGPGYAAVGIYGQIVYVDPVNDLVIAAVAAWPTADSRKRNEDRASFYTAIVSAIAHE